MNSKTLLKKLSIEEKINLTSGHGMWTSVGNDTIKTRNLVFADGPHGVRVYENLPGTKGFDEDKKAPSTLFPSAAAMASTFNPELIYEVGKTIAKECNHYNVDVLLGPGVNLKRSPLGGRNFEYYSEDPYLTGVIATNFINGVQSEGVGACIKHFALNEQEDLRRFVSSEADERTIHELYLLPFEMAIKNANPSSIMGSYNKVNGHYACESEYLLKDVLRNQWGYNGLVMSDWGGVQDKVKSIKNGMNLEMPGDSEFTDEVRKAFNNNELTEKELDDSLLPLFDLYDYCEQNPNKGKKANFEDNHAFASKVSEEAIVLLENDGILPLSKGIKIGVIGDFAQNPRINGGGSASLKSYKIDKPIDELNKLFTVEFAQGYNDDQTTDKLLEDVKLLMENNDTILFFTGTTPNLEVEGKDREHMDMPQGHIDVFNVIKTFNKKVIVILSNGSALNISPLLGHSNAIIEAWFLGNANAKPLVDVITGIVNPSGRLSETFPIRIENTPLYGLFPSKEDTVSYVGDIVNTGYRYYDTHKHDVRYPFGYGLSYSDFRYDSISLDKEVLTDGDSLQVTIQVTNTSQFDGYEVVQVYVRDKESYFSRPNKELKGFKKVYIKANETVDVSIELDERSFAVYSSDFKDFRVETGLFDILVGKNVNDILLEETIQFNSSKKLRSNHSIYHTVKYFKIHNKEKFDYVVKKYRDFPWFEIEEPMIRVFRRLQKEFKINNEDFENLLKSFVE